MGKRSKTILIASDHNGNVARRFLVKGLIDHGYDPVDMGPVTDDKADYTTYAMHLSNAIDMNRSLCGILICGTGIGMSIAANRWSSVRASLVHDLDEARKTREHNNSNVIVFGSWRSSKEDMLQMTLAWLDEDFGEGRHEKRVAKLDDPDGIVVVTGVFEIVHPGHIELFAFARSLGRVVVLLNSDRSAEDVKGRRPLFDFEWRRSILQRIDLIDEVLELDGSPGEIVERMGARFLVKGDVGIGKDEIRKIDSIPQSCVIKLFPLVKDVSSSDMRAHIKEGV